MNVGSGVLSKDENGYGQVRLRSHGGRHTCHRVSWEIVNGPIPEGQCVLRKCDTPACVNPSHLFLGTMKDNTQDMMRKGRNGYGVRYGTACYNAKTTEDDVKTMRARYDAGVTIKELAAIYNLRYRHVRNIVRRYSGVWENV